MADEQVGSAGEVELPANGRHREKRGSRRRATTAPSHMHVVESSLHGAARNMSDGGVYVVTGDQLRVQVVVRDRNGREQLQSGRIVRVEHLAHGAFGVAVEFD